MVLSVYAYQYPDRMMIIASKTWHYLHSYPFGVPQNELFRFYPYFDQEQDIW